MQLTLAAALVAGLVVGGLAPHAAGQAGATGPGGKTSVVQPVRRGKVVRKPLVNLEAQAQSRRPGQVLPGDPPPEKFAPPIPEPKPAPGATLASPTPPAAGATPPTPEPITPRAESRDSVTGQPLKAAPSPLDPAGGPRPLPASEGGSKPAPAAPAAPPAPATTPPPASKKAEPAAAPSTPPPASHSLETGVTPVPGTATASAAEGAPVAPGRFVKGEAPEQNLALREPVTPLDPARPEGASAADPARAPGEPGAVSVSNEPVDASVRVVSASASDVQWRPMDGAWGAMTTGESATGRFEIRTGLDGAAVVEIDGRVEVHVGPLSRLRVERQGADGGGRGAGRPAVALERGWFEVQAAASEPVETWVRTPDRTAGFTNMPGVRIGYSAFSGTAISLPSAAK